FRPGAARRPVDDADQGAAGRSREEPRRDRLGDNRADGDHECFRRVYSHGADRHDAARDRAPFAEAGDRHRRYGAHRRALVRRDSGGDGGRRDHELHRHARACLAARPAVVDRALAEAGLAPAAIDAVAVTAGPGLAGALLVGVVYAKAFAFAGDRALIGVHHMEGHLFAPALEDRDLAPPFVALLVSGGHTLLLDVPAWGRYRLFGETRDDAAGEAFDKVATLLGLGYPGGPAIEKFANNGDPERFTFPRPMLNEGFEFSFSGLK